MEKDHSKIESKEKEKRDSEMEKDSSNNNSKANEASPSDSIAGTSLTSTLQNNSLLESRKTVLMWESFTQRGIEHDFVQDLAQENAADSKKFDAESTEFYEKSLKLIEQLEEIEGIPKLLEDLRKLRHLIMGRHLDALSRRGKK